ncbi:hypothetical protein ACEZCY_19430 [Streptacidiphilus sp. N1-12]|uniref:Uncharacterized protein n=2 Tax=Streptacidiphilus alkalitolerans TaxID=3342712 RepID=A0ABV6WH58_9ACTN
MSEHDAEVALRAQLNALVEDRPASHSPAALVISKVRRSRRRRAAAGALAVALAVTGGALLGLDRSAHPPVPAKPAPLCRVPLPTGWATALADPANALPKGMTLVAAAPDGSRVFVQQGNRILQLTDRFRNRSTVLTLPAIPAGFTTTNWSVSGSFDGTWLVLALTPDDHHYVNTLGLYAWNASTGVTRTLMAAAHQPTQQLSTWVAGSGRVAWDSSTFSAEGMYGDNLKSHLVDLSSGSDQDPGGSVRAFLGDTMLVLDKGSVPRTVSLSGGTPMAVPDALKAFLRTHGSWGSNTGSGPAFSWGEGTTPVKDAAGKEIGKGPASWDLWWQGTPSVLRVTAPSGYFVAGVTPLAADYAVGVFEAKGQPITDSGTDERSVLIDLRDHSYAPLTSSQANALSDPSHAVDTAGLPRIPGC